MPTIPPLPPRRHFLSTLGAILAFHPKLLAISNKIESPGLAQFGRRFVTGLDSSGKSTITDDGPVPSNATWKRPGKEGFREGFEFWLVRNLPAALNEATDPLIGWEPINEAPPGGLVARFVSWQPGFEAPLHKTPTLDLVIVLSGKLELGLETESRMLGPGDVVVQRGTAHWWRVPGPEPCTLAAILVDASPGK